MPRRRARGLIPRARAVAALTGCSKFCVGLPALQPCRALSRVPAEVVILDETRLRPPAALSKLLVRQPHRRGQPSHRAPDPELAQVALRVARRGPPGYTSRRPWVPRMSIGTVCAQSNGATPPERSQFLQPSSPLRWNQVEPPSSLEVWLRAGTTRSSSAGTARIVLSWSRNCTHQDVIWNAVLDAGSKPSHAAATTKTQMTTDDAMVCPPVLT